MPATLLRKKLAQVFSSEFCEISRNIFSTEHPRTNASKNTPLLRSRYFDFVGVQLLLL